MTDFVQANTNGRLHDAAEPSLSPLDRAFLYGDAIYEVWRTYSGVLFAFDEHWRRLASSARALHLVTGLTDAGILREIKRAADAYREATSHEGEVYVRLQVSRGTGSIGLDPGLANQPSWVILVQALRPCSLAGSRAGWHLEVAGDLRRNPPEALNPAWKTGNYLNNLLCLREARARGADEVVILNTRGFVSEAAVCNLFFVRGSELLTPSLQAGILAGITRDLILHRIAPENGVKVRECGISPSEFPSFSECFLSSTTRDIAPVERIGKCRFRTGPETITARLKTAFAVFARGYAQAHPAFRI